MSKITSNIDASTFTISAFLIGYLLLDDLDPAEQNSIGNWFMMIGQVLCTNSAQQQVLNNKNRNNNNDPIIDGYNSVFNSLRKSVNTIDKELNKFP